MAIRIRAPWTRKRTLAYRTPDIQVVGLAIAGAIAALNGAAIWVSIIDRDYRLSVPKAFILALPAMFVRFSMTGINLTDDTVLIRNVRRTHRLPIADIANLRVGRKGLWPRVAIVRTVSGREICAFGIQGPNPITRPNNRRAENQVAEINREIAARQQQLAAAGASDRSL